MPQSKSHHLRSSCGDVESVSSSRPGSPTNRVKFLCSHGGKILPRPADGHLKYTGGETRVIGVHRDITFSELMKKVASMFHGEMILKYQLIPEDLDVLVTVKSNEDIRHMIDECDRHEHQGAPRLRAFLFPAKTPPETTTIATNATSINHESVTSHGKPSSLTKNHSSPSLYNQVAPANPNMSQNHHHHHHQPPPPPPQPYQPPRPPLDRHPHKASGVADYYRQQQSHNHGTSKGGHVYYPRDSSYDDYYGDCRYDRADSPPSPDVRPSSPGVRSGR